MQKLFSLLTQYRGLRKEIYILCFGRVVTNLGSMVWPMLTMILNQKLGLDAGAISVFFVITSLIMLPASLLGGKLADRFNKKNIIVRCDLVSIACYIACGLIPMSYATVALMVLAGVLQSMEGPSYDALFADLSMTKDRERAYSLDYLGANLGLVLSPTIAGVLFKNYLWLSFIISGVAIACSTALIFLLIRDITPVEDAGEEAVYQKGRGTESLFCILKDNRVVVLYLGISALYWSAYSQYSYLMPLDMGRVHGEDGAVIYGTVSSLNCIVVVAFTPLITRLTARLPDPKKFLVGEALIAAGYFAFLTLLGRVPAYYLAMLLFTWGEIFATIASGPYLSSRIPASHRGRITGFSSVLGTAISGACDLSVGHVYDGIGSTAAWVMVLALVGVSAVLTLVLISRDRKAYPKLYSQGAQE